MKFCRDSDERGNQRSCALLDFIDDNFMRSFLLRKNKFISVFVIDSCAFLCIIENFLVFLCFCSNVESFPINLDPIRCNLLHQ